MRFPIMAIAALALGAAAPAAAQVSIGGIVLGQPGGGGNDGIQHTNAARVDLGGGQAARVVAVPGRDTPAQGGADVKAAPGAQSSSVPGGTAGAGAAAIDGGALAPKAYGTAGSGQTGASRSVEVNPGR